MPTVSVESHANRFPITYAFSEIRARKIEALYRCDHDLLQDVTLSELSIEPPVILSILVIATSMKLYNDPNWSSRVRSFSTASTSCLYAFERVEVN